MPQFTMPTLHGLKLVFDQDEATNVWNILGYCSLSRTNVRPLPEWWHLPSDAVAVALSLLLTFFGRDPVAAVEELILIKIGAREPETHLSDALIQIFGFSAGSYAGTLVYRIFIGKGHALGCSCSAATSAFTRSCFTVFVCAMDFRRLRPQQDSKPVTVPGLDAQPWCNVLRTCSALGVQATKKL